MWTVEPSDDYLRRQKTWQKRWKREIDAVLGNLNTYLAALNEGANPLQVKLGFVHPEGKGAVAIDERGHGKGRLKASRLYVFPDGNTRQLHVITLGDKDSQPEDVKMCHEYIETVRKRVTRDEEAANECTRLGAPHFEQRRRLEGTQTVDSGTPTRR